ncbi:MAG: VWA domain-containing protein [Thermoplasmata archaeon]|nr:VWA domain-containing protein [Thermoplasmata archaeon]
MEPLPAPVVRPRHVLVLDLSKSMLAPLPDPSGVQGTRRKIEVARTAVYRILENAEATGAFFGLVTFTDSARVAVPLTEIRHENLPYIESLISMLTPSGRSAIWDGIALGADLLRRPTGEVAGTLALVTDGWDNASSRFRAPASEPLTPESSRRLDVVPHILPNSSQLTLRIIGIGSGSERDKGVDSEQMNGLVEQLRGRANAGGIAAEVTYQEVVTSTDLFSQMVNSFIDVGYEGARPLEDLHPDELAEHAARAAKALKAPGEHATISQLRNRRDLPSAPAETGAGALPADVDVLELQGGTLPPHLTERYGPLGEVVEAFVARDYASAMNRLFRAQSLLPALSRYYWEARIHYARGEVVEAARSLLHAWVEADRLPAEARGRIGRRLALLQSRIQNDSETETLVRFMDETQHRLERKEPELGRLLEGIFEKLLELRTTYQLARVGGTDQSLMQGAIQHENSVEEIFGLLQDIRLRNTQRDTVADGALDFMEICLAEMR